MQYVLAVLFACLGGWLWVYVSRAIAAGLVMRPMHTPWIGEREPRYYDRRLEPIRYWLTVVAWIVLAVLASSAFIRCLLLFGE